MSFGIVVWLLGQMIINVGMVLALLPVIGIPLPLVSYGGSALVPSLVALGLLIGFARREPEAARGAAPSAAGPLRRPVRGPGAGPRSLGVVRRRCAFSSPAAAPPATPRPCSPPPTPCAGSTRASRSPASARRAAWRPGWSPRPATRSS